jgi:hypothetical protein
MVIAALLHDAAEDHGGELRLWDISSNAAVHTQLRAQVSPRSRRRPVELARFGVTRQNCVSAVNLCH